MTELQPALDWEAVHRQREAVDRALAAGATAAPEEIKRVLDARAHALARPLAGSHPAQLRDLLVFSLSGSRYAFDPAHALEVLVLRDLVPVPCASRGVLGVVNHRGRVLPVLDLRPALGLPDEGPLQEAQVLVVEAAGMVFGLLANAVAGVVRLNSGEDGSQPVAMAAQRHAFIEGVTADLVAILDLDVLMQDPRMLVNEEVPLGHGG